jgi:hypothetical protein
MSSKQDFSPQGRATSSADDARHERRLHIAIPVKVFSSGRTTDAQTCCTYDISARGARLVAPHGVREVGQIISLQRMSRRAAYKVVWIGKPGTSRQGQVGLAAINPNNVIWENEIMTRLKRGE